MPEDGERLLRLASGLAEAAGLGPASLLTPVAGGRNNQAFVLRAGDTTAFLKVYFRHPDDPRDRLGAETAFLRHTAALGLACVPRLLGADPQAGLVLLDHVPGRRLTPGAIGPAEVAAAAAFYQAVNARPADLAPASEACFSLPEHLERVQGRLDRLVRAAASGALRADAASLILDALAPAWATLRASLADAGSRRLGDAFTAPLPLGLRRVSPSDFGFHNALRRPDGSLVFLDFEYAGLDDPAKMVCDFACQPAIPVPLPLLSDFADRVGAVSPEDTGLADRVALLRPVYRLKWCCILLNDFLPVGDARRRFAVREETETRRDRQLALARHALQRHLTE